MVYNLYFHLLIFKTNKEYGLIAFKLFEVFEIEGFELVVFDVIE
jgi:hypothetical protein